MPTPVPIEIFQIARTEVQRTNVSRWLEFLNVNDPDAVIADMGDITDPAMLIALAAKRCYMSFEPGLNPNVTRTRKDIVEYFDNILASGHGSVLEHAVYSFALENVSRVFTAEMNRHRAGWAISEGSLRFIRFGDNIPYWIPTSIAWNAHDDSDLAFRKAQSRAIFEAAFSNQESYYRSLEAVWAMNEKDKNFRYKKTVTSMMRRIVGLGVATGGVWTGNIRALRHVITMRANELAAEEEIFHVFSRIAKMIKDQEPLMFGDFEQTPGGGWKPTYTKV